MLNGFGDAARMEGQGILDTLHGLPKQVVGQIVIGQVAVDALDILMGPGVKPGLVFRLQDVATAAELRTLGFGVEPRGAKGHKDPQNRHDRRRNQHIDQDFSLGKGS